MSTSGSMSHDTGNGDPDLHASRLQKTVPPGVSRKRAKKTLHDLPNMPIDILFEIFSKLTPRDLLSISRTTKSFRQLLLSRQAATVWKAARLATPPFLERPSDVSEPYWANLVYGKSFCQVCGSSANKKRVFFELRRRLCASCMESHCVTPPRNINQPPEFDVTALELLPYVMYVVGLRKRRHFWREDVERVTLELKRLREDIEQKKPGAVEALENYKQAQAAQTLAIMEHSAECRRVLQPVNPKMRLAQRRI
ncbi:uncharacterized protein TRAVEDRAFT_73314 [Trametes versicolor FP-101664 SS1]|uniref:uncharacterized protein n=1 Tax=Trametes versicolor (strain FP-101664) TaxID=717944 RepID=UPI0004623A63|nr:uncharacterized protein TRAVEDRAFT_73314 [Trametes versicolor FP-101664 SS1]EIW57054.1 hypothetical protein TRAVEDRAFT_73314 [Trametes versicolor FP-101664 SS1]